MLQLKNFINGHFEELNEERHLHSIEPATGEPHALIPDSGAAEVEKAVRAAERAFPKWSVVSLDERRRILMKIARGIDRHRDELAHAESKDNGKPVWLARKIDIPRASANFRFFATAITQFASESHEMPGLAINYTLRQPLGVVGCISPWNLPLYLFTWKIAPALAAGNTVIAKPSEITPVTAFHLSKICKEAGLPAGVLNIVHGKGPRVGDELVKHPKIKAISFTGGTSTGERIASIAAPQFKKLSLEMGGKNPNIIFSDCNYERSLDYAVRSAFSNQGEICLCGSRIFIEASLYDQFKDDFVERVKDLSVGDPLEETSDLGAIVSEQHMKKILSHIDLAREEGGNILCGGQHIEMEGRCAGGYFIEPTVIDGLPQACRTNREEIFGPVVTLMPFEGESEVLEYANDVPYGLSATIWTENINRAHRVARELEAGIIWVNCWLLRDLRTPFGGVKQSGIGREGGQEALRFFTEPKNVCIRILDE